MTLRSRRVVSRTAVVRELALAFALATHASPARAQVAGAAITGAIVDQAGAPVPSATVTVTSAATNQAYIGVTTREGIYTVPRLPSGQYRLEIALPGFKAIRRDGLRVATGEKV